MCSSLLDFIEVLNEVLHNNNPSNTEWNQRLITEVGGRGTLHGLWDRLRRTNRAVCRKRKGSQEDDDLEQDGQKKTKVADSSLDNAEALLNGLAVNDNPIQDPQPGPSGVARPVVQGSRYSSPQREALLEQDSSIESFDSVYDNLSRYGHLKLEQPDAQIERSLEGIQQGRVQITLRKCLISVAFDETP